jgi:uncharacterized membrane protein YbhN (UPF0104 family)
MRHVTNDEGTRKSLIRVWLDESAHPILALAASLALEVGAAAGLVYWVGWSRIWHALAVENAEWFALCAAGQLVAYFGYTLALKGVACVDRGVKLDLALSFTIVSIGFAPIFTANAGGGFSIDRVTLREAGMSRRKAFCRVLALSALEYAVLAPAVAVVGVLLVLGIGGEATPDIALPWLAVVPGLLVAAWLTSPRNRDWAHTSARDGRLRRGFGHAVASLTILRALLLDPWRYGYAFAGAALYWAGDMLTLWAALRVFDVDLSVPVLVLAYGTGWALTRRSLPLGGPGVVEILLAWVLTWFHVPFAAAASGVIAYRLFNLWLALLPAAAVLPFARRFQRRLARAATTPG